MIIPDKETEAFLNQNADSRSIDLLCRLRLIRGIDTLKAQALLRDESAWRGLFKRAVRILSVFCAVAGLFFLAIARWNWSFAPAAYPVLSAALLVCAALKRKSAFFDIAGVSIIGALIFLSDSLFGTDVLPYQQVALWTALVFLWETADTTVPSFTKTILLADAALVCLAFQNPLGFFDPVRTAILLIAFNITVAFIGYRFKKDVSAAALTAFAATLIPSLTNILSRAPLGPSDACLIAAPVLFAILLFLNKRTPVFATAAVPPVLIAVLSVRVWQILPVRDHVNRIVTGLIPAVSALFVLGLRTNGREETESSHSGMNIRQILSCLNVSVFDDKNESALLTGGRLLSSLTESEVFSSFGQKVLIWIGALSMLFAFSNSPAIAGGVLFGTGAILYRMKRNSPLIETLLLSGALNVTAALTGFSLFSAVAATGALLLFVMSAPNRNGFVTNAALLFAGTLLFAVGEARIITTAAVMSVAGTVLFLIPAGRYFCRRASVVFMAVPPVVFAVGEIAGLTGKTLPFSPSAVFAAAIEAILLFGLLYRDLNGRERIIGLSCIAVIALLAALFSPGAACCLVLGAIAYFANESVLGKAALCGLLFFITAGLLQTRLSFGALAVTGLLSAAVFYPLSFYRKGKRLA